jgi:hypothetical protein
MRTSTSLEVSGCRLSRVRLSCLISLVSVLAFVTACGDCRQGPPQELVMPPGTRIDLSVGGRQISVIAQDSLKRRYEWNKCALESQPCVRSSRFFGTLGVYDPAPEFVHWRKGCEGITRPVIQEAQVHFKTQALAEWWVRAYNPHPSTTAWTNSGLLVRFATVPERHQLNVDVMQICVNGQPPKALADARDDAIRVTGSQKLFDCARVSDAVMNDTVRSHADTLPPSQAPKLH